ncbi:MAG: hypothetical protein JSV89_10260 [Spirochaetaceae bacterium]|nr:MAG: hypothetical protein JSV89_10260 [Spirochaetaceae bacterium]
MISSSKGWMKLAVLLKSLFSRRTRRAMKEVKRLKGMIHMVDSTADIEIACEEAYRLLDEYADALLLGEDTAALLPQVKHHLEMCMDCREELDALLSALRATTG